MAIERKRCRFLLLGYVVMPEHVHLVISEPERFSPSKLMQVLKQRVSANLAAIHPGRAFWQRRFYDFNVWSERKLSEKLDYIHGNPIKRGLVEHPRDWPWSSWSNYVEGRGLIDVDMVNVARGAAPGLEKSKPAPF